MKRQLSAILMTGLVMAALVGTASVIATPGISVSNSAGISTRAEQTEWRFQFVNGKLQKRLWSITYNKWLTDWMDA